MTARTLYDKHIDSHTVCPLDDQGHVLLYIDRQVINEYTSPQAFSGLRDAGRGVWRPGTALAVVDHVNPTAPKRIAAMPDAGGARQVSYLAQNCRDFGIELLDILDKRQGIEHVIAPEQGFILPGKPRSYRDTWSSVGARLAREGRTTILDLAPIPGAAAPSLAPRAHRQNCATGTRPSTNTHTRCSHSTG